MISIVKVDQLPWVQPTSKRQVLKLKDSTRYSDGTQDYAWLTFENRFNEKTRAINIEITQFNLNQDIIDKVEVLIHDYVCKPNQECQLKSPFPIKHLTASISVKVLAIEYEESHLIQDIFQPLVQPLPVKLSKRKQKKSLVKLRIKQKASWVLYLAWFLLAVTTIITVTILQFGFI
jgi:hypothetical protein